MLHNPKDAKPFNTSQCRYPACSSAHHLAHGWHLRDTMQPCSISSTVPDAKESNSSTIMNASMPPAAADTSTVQLSTSLESGLNSATPSSAEEESLFRPWHRAGTFFSGRSHSISSCAGLRMTGGDFSHPSPVPVVAFFNSCFAARASILPATPQTPPLPQCFSHGKSCHPLHASPIFHNGRRCIRSRRACHAGLCHHPVEQRPVKQAPHACKQEWLCCSSTV